VGSIIAVAIIVLSSFSSVVGKVSSDDDLVEIDVEFCGLGKKHTVQLTQQEADEVELLFADIQSQLENVETREEAEVIFKEAVVELDKYGLLGEMSIREVQRLVTGGLMNPKFVELIENMYRGNRGIFPGNFMCLVAGSTTNSWFVDIFTLVYFGIGVVSYLLFAPIFLFLQLLPEEMIERFYDTFSNFVNIVEFLIIFLPLLYSMQKPVNIGGIITFGYSWVELSNTIPVYHRPSEGWVSTIGLGGIKLWNGKFYGHLGSIPIINKYYIGATGFTGLKLYNSDGINFIGYARHVKLNDNHP